MSKAALHSHKNKGILTFVILVLSQHLAEKHFSLDPYATSCTNFFQQARSFSEGIQILEFFVTFISQVF